MGQGGRDRAGVPPSPVISTEAVQSPDRKHGCKETRPADSSAMRAPRRTCRSIEILDVSVERSSPRGYAFFVPLGGGERPFDFTPTFTGQGYYSKTAARLRGGFRIFILPFHSVTSPDHRACRMSRRALRQSQSCGAAHQVQKAASRDSSCRP